MNIQRFTGLISNFRKSLDARWLRYRLNDKYFTIISNNCWGGSIYQELKLTYTSPFVGLFLYPPCYIKMLENLREYVESDIKIIERSKYQMANVMKAMNPYPIGLIGSDVELHFVHYKDPEIAVEKWVRRCKRVNFDNLRVAFVERELSTPELIKRFDGLPYKSKVCFSSKNMEKLSSVVWIKECNDRPYVTDLTKYQFLYKHRFDVADWLNGGDGKPNFIYRIFERILCPAKRLNPFVPLPGEIPIDG